VFWVATTICVVAIAASSFTGSVGAWSSWTTGVSLLLVMLSFGAIAWSEFRSNPEADAERGEWTNKMLFYTLIFTILRSLWHFCTCQASTLPIGF
jgi:hypothetical protein